MSPRFLLRLAALASIELLVPGAYHKLGTAFAAAPAAITVADRISVATAGTGPDVILIPGLASSAHVWDATVAHLLATHRVHIVQVAGFAGTAPGANATGPVLAPTVAALHDYIVAHRLQGAAVIGHSLGGLMALKLAVDHPGDAGRLMIVDSLPFYGMMMGPTASVGMVEPRAKAVRDAVIAGTQEAYAASEPRTMAGLVKSKGPAADAALAAAVASDRRVVAQAMYDDFTTDLRPDLTRIAVPVTMLYPWDAATGAPQSAYDALYTGAYAPLKQAHVKRIDGSFHFIMIDQPQAFEQEVDAFLA